MKDLRQFLQIRLSTLLLTTLAVALVAILISNGRTHRAKIRELEQQVETFKQHLPEYFVARDIQALQNELEKSKTLYGTAHPIVRKLETEITILERMKKTEAIRATFEKQKAASQ